MTLLRYSNTNAEAILFFVVLALLLILSFFFDPIEGKNNRGMVLAVLKVVAAIAAGIFIIYAVATYRR